MAASNELEFLKRPNSNPDTSAYQHDEDSMSYADAAAKGPKQSDAEKYTFTQPPPSQNKPI